jgi:hypothetical protein
MLNIRAREQKVGSEVIHFFRRERFSDLAVANHHFCLV